MTYVDSVEGTETDLAAPGPPDVGCLITQQNNRYYMLYQQ